MTRWQWIILCKFMECMLRGTFALTESRNEFVRTLIADIRGSDKAEHWLE